MIKLSQSQLLCVVLVNSWVVMFISLEKVFFFSTSCKIEAPLADS